nr:transposase [Brucella grignonensis]
MSNTTEHGHRCIKQRIRSMPDFKTETTANVTLFGIELVHMMRKRQVVFPLAKALSSKQQFEAPHRTTTSDPKTTTPLSVDRGQDLVPEFMGRRSGAQTKSVKWL